MKSIPFHRRLLFHVGGLMLLLATLSVLSLFSSYILLEKTDEDARTINLSGSLRMLNYQALSLIAEVRATSESEATFHALLDRINNLLTRDILAMKALESENPVLDAQFRNVSQSWQNVVRPLFDQAIHEETISLAHLRGKVDTFVDDVDKLVSLYQKQAETHLSNFRLILLTAHFATLLLIILGMVMLHRRAELPLKQLTETAIAFGERRFDQRAETVFPDELGLLSETMNDMAAALHELYHNLESQVREKTRELEVSAASLDFLYRFAQAANEDSEKHLDLEPWLTTLAHITNIPQIDLCLAQPSATIPYALLRTDIGTELPERCQKRDCHDCLMPETNVPYGTAFQLNIAEQHYGILNVRSHDGEQLREWQMQLILSFADQVSQLLEARQRHDQEERLALLRERSVIARELHDSLAQALSYLKIQVTRQKRLLDREPLELDRLHQVTEEIRDGVATAYSQLRELLTTFRLPATGEGFSAALKQTLEQFQEQHADIHFQLENGASHIPLTPEEGIHLLQLTREALQNACRHSGGTQVRVQLQHNGQELRITVADNGLGIDEPAEKPNHYGLAIMQERARNLGGSLELLKTPGGGTTVQVRFRPRELLIPNSLAQGL